MASILLSVYQRRRAETSGIGEFGASTYSTMTWWRKRENRVVRQKRRANTECASCNMTKTRALVLKILRGIMISIMVTGIQW